MDNRPILLVEDNEDDEAFALRAFRENAVPNAVIVARDGQEAVDYLFDRNAAVPALVILDLKIPKIGGLEVLRRLRADARTQYVPVVTLSSSAHDSDMRASYDLGANSYVCKPLDIDKFTRDMGVLAEYWLRVNIPLS